MANNLKKLDGLQVLRSVYDDVNNRLRVDAQVTTTIGEVEVIVDHTEDSIRIGDGTKLATATTVSSKTGLDTYIINEDLDIRDLNALQDNIAIQDSGGDRLEIESDGSITIKSKINTDITGKLKYAEITSIASSVETTIVSHTAAIGVKTYLQQISVSGDNIAKYKVKINGTTIDTKRTYFGGDLEKEFIFNGSSNPGLEVVPGDIINVTIEHLRPNVGDFNGKIQYIEAV